VESSSSSSSSLISSSLHSHVTLKPERCDTIKLSNLLLPRKSGNIKSLQLLSTSGTVEYHGAVLLGHVPQHAVPRQRLDLGGGACLFIRKHANEGNQTTRKGTTPKDGSCKDASRGLGFHTVAVMFAVCSPTTNITFPWGVGEHTANINYEHNFPMGSPRQAGVQQRVTFVTPNTAAILIG